MKTAVIIPTYNERKNIENIIKAVLNLGIMGLEVIVVDDNSPDGTFKIVEKMKEVNPGVHLILRPKKMGLGTAYISGFRYALKKGAEYVLEMDADFSHDPEMIPSFLEKIKEKHLVIGSRYSNGISIVNWPLHRLMLSLMAGKYVRLITGMKLSDPTSGFKCYRKEVLEAINFDKISSSGYSFQIEMKYRIFKKGFSIGEIPIIFIDRQNGASKMSKAIILEALIIAWKLRFGRIR
jgi:dolichol-phosphate mannosyltransferase